MDHFMYKNILKDVMLPHAEWNMPIKWARQRSETHCKSSQAVVSRQPPIGDGLAASISVSQPYREPVRDRQPQN